MKQCRFCLKYRYAFNESGLCDKCAKKANIGSTRLVCFEQVDVDKAKPMFTNGASTVLSRSEWLSLRNATDKYYSSVSDDEIDEYNAALSQKLQQAKIKKNGKSGYIYLLRSSVGFYKIGRATNVDSRMKQHCRDYPIMIEPVFTLHVSDVVRCESFLLRTFKEKKKQGEWFDLNNDEIEWICLLTNELLESLIEPQCS